MKFFLDTANLEELKKGASWGIVDGVTTNPTLIAKEGRPIEEQIREICEIVDGDISAEVVSTDRARHGQGRPRAGAHPQERRGEMPADARRNHGHLGAQQGRHPRQRDAVLLGGTGAARRQGRRLHHQSVRGPARRYRLHRHGPDPQHHPDLSRTTDSRRRSWRRRCARRRT